MKYKFTMRDFVRAFQLGFFVIVTACAVGCASTRPTAMAEITTTEELPQIAELAADSPAPAPAPPLAPEKLKVQPKPKTVYLHVRVSSKWWLVRQVSEAKAWTTTDKAGKKKTKVGEIELRLQCHGTETKTVKNASSVSLKNTMTGFPAVGKNPAEAIAWSKNPKIGPVKATARP